MPGETMPDLMGEVLTSWTLVDAIIRPLLDRRGVQTNLESIQEAAIDYIMHLQHSEVMWDGENTAVYAIGYITITVHLLLHLGMSVWWWGNVWDTWCFEYERCASPNPNPTALLVSSNPAPCTLTL